MNNNSYVSSKGYFYNKNKSGKIKRVSKNTYLKKHSNNSNKNINNDNKNINNQKTNTNKSLINNFKNYSSNIENYININKNKVLGKGSYGKVYKGTVIKKISKLNKNNKVAIKHIMKKKNMSKEDDKTNIEKEVEILLELNHPNIVKLYHIFETSVSYKLVLEIINGKELTYYLDNHFKNINKFIKNEEWKILLQIANAINYIHNLSIMHRDIKPANVMYDGNNIKLIDFGFAVKKDVAKRYCGTRKYMAPEIYNRLEYTSKVDIWSYGALLYKMFAGCPPYYSESNKDKDKHNKLKEYKWDNRIYGSYISNNYVSIERHLDFHLIKKLLDATLEFNQNKRCNIKYVIKNINYFFK